MKAAGATVVRRASPVEPTEVKNRWPLRLRGFKCRCASVDVVETVTVKGKGEK